MVTPLVNQWQGMGIVLLVFGGLMGALALVQRRFAPDPELVRKLFHIGMGLFTLTLPWLFGSIWPVIALTAALLLVMFGLRNIEGLRARFGKVMGGVGRSSLGEIYFPLSVAALFCLTRDRIVFYVIPILILTLADSTAALIGVRYGRARYQGIDGAKSAEGSIAFFAVAFMSTHVPLLLFTQTGRAESLLIAAILGLLIMLFESIAWRGLDNLFIPLAAYFLLERYESMSTGALVARLSFTFLFSAGVFLYRRRTTLNDGALLGVVLLGYVYWWLGGWRWMLPPMILFIGYQLFAPRTEQNARRIHNFHAVLSVCAAGLLWSGLALLLRRGDLLLPYTAAYAAHLAIAGIARLKFDCPNLRTSTVLVTCIFKSWLVMTLVYLLWEGVHAATLMHAAVGLASVAASALAFYAWQPNMEDCPTDGPRWKRQALVGALGSAIAAIPIFLKG
ncbi:MAG: diacylglycerol/polyprenol kinase family protein [Blastocatellia bacterium]